MTVKATVKIKNKLGMHARPTLKLFELVNTFDSDVILRNEAGEEAEASSVIAMLMLNSEQGKLIEIEVTGHDEQEALQAMIALFNSGFDEE